MEFDRIKVNRNENYYAFRMGDVEKVNPILYYKEFFLKSKIIIYSDLLQTEAKVNNFVFKKGDVFKAAKNEAINQWRDILKKIYNIQIPETIKLLLNSQKKKEQVKLLKGFNFTSYELLAFIFYAYTEERYLLSQYSGEHYPKGTNKEQLPIISYLNEKGITKVGETDLSDGQLIQTVRHKKRNIAKFLDRGDEWHCFFITYSSLRGEESWKDGKPHFHYISDKFGISREDVIKNIKSRSYKLGSLPHINFKRVSN